MNNWIEISFWICLLIVGYIYVGYPLLAFLLSKLFGRPVQQDNNLPTVTVIIAAFNEVAHIKATVENKLAQDYPAEKLKVIVVSDGSEDGTDEVVEKIDSSRLECLRQEPRAGKTSALNMGVALAESDIVVFSDANSIYAADAIRRIVSRFADGGVGYVTGKMVYVNPDGSLIGDGCSSYMKYENFLRSCETRLASVIGVDGGIDAIRRHLYEPMRHDQLPDFVLPLTVAEKEYRVVYADDALLHEDALTEQDSEYRMRVRVSLRALCALRDMRHLMNPFLRPLLSFQIVSHKLMRYLAFIPLLGLIAANVALLAEPFYQMTFVLQVIFYLLAAVGWQSRGRFGGFVIGLPFYFVLLNWAAAHALVRFFRGERAVLWSPRSG